MNSQAFVPFSEALSVLYKLHQSKRTGKFFLATENNYTASIELFSGKICFLTYRIFQGQKALIHLKNIKKSKYRFDETSQVSIDNDLPETATIFTKLGYDFESIEAIKTSSTNQSQVNKQAVTAVQIKQVEQLLLDLVGPMAKVICKSAALNAKTTSDFLEGVAQKIPDPELVEQLKQRLAN